MTAGDLPASAGIGRVGLTVADLAETVSFYREVVGLSVHSREEGTVALGDPDDAFLSLRADPDRTARPETAAGLYHTAFRVPTRAALGDALGRVREGWQLSGASDHLVSEALYLRDPEGNGVEIYCDRDRDEWPTTDDGRVEMVTDPLDLEALANEAAGAQAVPAGSDIGHVHLEVTGLDTAGEFYADGLGMNVRQEMSGALFLAAGDYHHHVGANVWNRRSGPSEDRGLDWFEVLVPADALDEVHQRIETAGFDASTVDGGFAVSDPDGIELRVRSEREA